jgi:CheY-like chemotaxis protein
MSTVDILATTKPRVLIADDSRIVRATLIKHIEGMFEFREALDGEQAWETLLIDPSIRVVITDLTMPKLDGYGLLNRIRSSKIGRIRELPVVVVSGSDEAEERERAKAAGADDLITKGIDTAQLLSRLDILARLAGTQQAFERSLEALMRSGGTAAARLLDANVWQTQAEALLASAAGNRKSFVVLNVCIGLRYSGAKQISAPPPAGVVDAVGRLLGRTVRQSDLVAKTGRAEFSLAAGSVAIESARLFAQRVCGAIASANLVQDPRMAFIAGCGLSSLVGDEWPDGATSFQALVETARRRAVLGVESGVSGVVGPEDEIELRSTGRFGKASADSQARGDIPDMPVLLQWVREGRQAEVLPYLDRLSKELQPLIELLRQQGRA